MEIIYENIEKLAYQKNINQKEIADLSSLSRQTINTLLTTKSKNCRLGTIYKISKALDIEFSELFKRNFNAQLAFDESISKTEYVGIYVQNVNRSIRGSLQKSLSSFPGVRESTISLLLSGKTTNPTLRTLFTISEQLNIETAKLFQRRN